jgi:hypothetical protein
MSLEYSKNKGQHRFLYKEKYLSKKANKKKKTFLEGKSKKIHYQLSAWQENLKQFSRQKEYNTI